MIEIKQHLEEKFGGEWNYSEYHVGNGYAVPTAWRHDYPKWYGYTGATINTKKKFSWINIYNDNESIFISITNYKLDMTSFIKDWILHKFHLISKVNRSFYIKNHKQMAFDLRNPSSINDIDNYIILTSSLR